MKYNSELEQLLFVSQLQYDRQKQTYTRIIGEEARLRYELERLSALGKPKKDVAENLTSMRAIGADLLWQGWLGRSKADVNMKLARVLAKKAYEQEKVRKAFGKLIALEKLAKQENDTQLKRRQKHELGAAITSSLS